MVAGSCYCYLVYSMVRDPKKDEAKANFSADLAEARKQSEEASIPKEELQSSIINVSEPPLKDFSFPPEGDHCPSCGEEFCKYFKCKWIWGAIMIALTAWYFWGKG